MPSYQRLVKVIGNFSTLLGQLQGYAKFPVNTPYIPYINSHIVLLNLNICCGNKCTLLLLLLLLYELLIVVAVATSLIWLTSGMLH
jgi:hypothetical protein